MKKILLSILIITALFSSCTKNAGSSGAASAATTGQGGSLARFSIVGNYLYTVDDQKLHVYDISNGADPVLKKTTNAGFQIETIYPLNDKLFIGSSSAVYIFSITDPVNPQKLSTAISPQVLRHCDPVVAKDTVAFATLRTTGLCGGTQSILAVYDIRNITAPVQKATINLHEPYGLGYANDVLYVCDKSQGLVLFDISKPFEPVYIKNVTDGNYTDVICFQNTLICWVDDGVILYDISNNKDPLFLAKII